MPNSVNRLVKFGLAFSLVTFCFLLSNPPGALASEDVGGGGSAEHFAAVTAAAVGVANEDCTPRSPCLRDLVSAQAAVPTRYALVAAGAATWRKGMRSAIVTPLPGAEEGPIASPPQGVVAPEDTWFSYPEGRNYAPMVASIRLAHAAFNKSYSWMLFGDDDTVFVTENVLRMLRRLQLDPSVPYILTDDQASRCHFDNLPASLSCIAPGVPEERRRVKNGSGSGTEETCILHPAVAPCTAERLQAADVCPTPHDPEMWFYGGSGVILSRGLLEALSREQWRVAEDGAASGNSGGDSQISRLFWDAGFGTTNPSLIDGAGEERNKRGKMPKYRCRFGRSSRYVWENAAAKAQEEGHNCDEDCMFLLKEGVSMHLRLHNEQHNISASLGGALADTLLRLYPEILRAQAVLLSKGYKGRN